MDRILFRGSKKSSGEKNGGFILMHTLLILSALSVFFLMASSFVSAQFALAQKKHNAFYDQLSASNHEESYSYQGNLYESD